MGGGGHPPLSALILSWALYPTLTGYLSRSLLGSFFPSPPLMLLGLMEYPLVGFGLASMVARLRVRITRGVQVGVIALLVYVGAQLGAHFLLNLQSVNLRLLSHANPEIAEAAADRIRGSADSTALPALQQRLLWELEHRGFAGTSLLDALTQIGGAKGWQDLLESGRLGVAGPHARAWRVIIDNVREMTNPLYADVRGGVRSPDFRDEDIARLFDALAVKLADHLKVTADSEAALTLLSLMKERPDLCTKYFELVPNGLRDQAPQQAALDLVGSLALMKAGRSADGKYDYQAMLVKNETMRFGQDADAVAAEWAAWAKSDAARCH